MNKLLCFMMMGAFCLGCDRQVTPPKSPHSMMNHVEISEATPVDQSSSQTDLAITQAIRQKVIDNKDLSVNAKNVKIITREGIVILKGEVNSEEEKRLIEKIATQVQGVRKLDNQINVSKNAKNNSSGQKLM